jgi:hypothetical protein
MSKAATAARVETDVDRVPTSGRGWYIGTAEGRPAEYPMAGDAKRVDKIVSSQSAVRDQTAKALEQVLVAAGIAIVASALVEILKKGGAPAK